MKLRFFESSQQENNTSDRFEIIPLHSNHLAALYNVPLAPHGYHQGHFQK